MKNYIVTGATGFVGKNLIDYLIKKNERVTVIVRNKHMARDLWRNKVAIIEQDLVNCKNLEASFFLYDISEAIIIHFAWDGTSGDKRSCEEIQLNNVKTSCDFMRRMRELGCRRFVNAGSIMEYEAIKTVLADGIKPQRNTLYSAAKLSADFMLKIIAADIDVEYVNIIISNIYGPGERSKRFLNSVIRGLIQNVDIKLTDGYQMYDFIYVTDAMKMIEAVAKEGKPFASYYIGNASQRALREYIIDAKEIVHSSSKLLFGEVPFYGNTLTYTEFDSGKVQRELGIVPQVSFEDGLKITRDSILKEQNGI